MMDIGEQNSVSVRGACSKYCYSLFHSEARLFLNKFRILDSCSLGVEFKLIGLTKAHFFSVEFGILSSARKEKRVNYDGQSHPRHVFHREHG
jgi:hypothetical protein